jgi:ketosteroid isomerase-like protein
MSNGLTPRAALVALGEAWDALDIDRFVALFAGDAVVVDPLLPRTAEGLDDIRALYTDSMAELSACRVRLTHVLTSDVLGMAEGRFESVLAADGSRMDFDFAIAVEVRDGEVSRLAEYYDTRPLLPS